MCPQNALDLTAPACGRLLHHRPHAATAAASDGDGDGDGRRRETPQTTGKPAGSQSPSWCQLSGHPDCFSRAGPGTIWKKCSGGTERNVYEALSAEPHLRHVVPRFLREVEYKGEKYIELQDLLHSFRDPYVMDIKMGARTFLESEVQNTFAREDLYLKVSLGRRRRRRRSRSRVLFVASHSHLYSLAHIRPRSFFLFADDRRRCERADRRRKRFEKSDQATVHAVPRGAKLHQHLGLQNRSDEGE